MGLIQGNLGLKLKKFWGKIKDSTGWNQNLILCEMHPLLWKVPTLQKTDCPKKPEGFFTGFYIRLFLISWYCLWLILDGLRDCTFLIKTQIWSEVEISNYLQRTLSLEAEQRKTQSGKKLLLGNAESQTQLACFALFFSSHFLSDPSPIIGNACQWPTDSLTHWLTN